MSFAKDFLPVSEAAADIELELGATHLDLRDSTDTGRALLVADGTVLDDETYPELASVIQPKQEEGEHPYKYVSTNVHASGYIGTNEHVFYKNGDDATAYEDFGAPPDGVVISAIVTRDRGSGVWITSHTAVRSWTVSAAGTWVEVFEHLFEVPWAENSCNGQGNFALYKADGTIYLQDSIFTLYNVIDWEDEAEATVAAVDIDKTKIVRVQCMITTSNSVIMFLVSSLGKVYLGALGTTPDANRPYVAEMLTFETTIGHANMYQHNSFMEYSLGWRQAFFYKLTADGNLLYGGNTETGYKTRIDALNPLKCAVYADDNKGLFFKDNQAFDYAGASAPIDIGTNPWCNGVGDAAGFSKRPHILSLPNGRVSFVSADVITAADVLITSGAFVTEPKAVEGGLVNRLPDLGALNVIMGIEYKTVADVTEDERPGSGYPEIGQVVADVRNRLDDGRALVPVDGAVLNASKYPKLNEALGGGEVTLPNGSYTFKVVADVVTWPGAFDTMLAFKNGTHAVFSSAITGVSVLGDSISHNFVLSLSSDVDPIVLLSSSAETFVLGFSADFDTLLVDNGTAVTEVDITSFNLRGATQYEARIIVDVRVDNTYITLDMSSIGKVEAVYNDWSGAISELVDTRLTGYDGGIAIGSLESSKSDGSQSFIWNIFENYGSLLMDNAGANPIIAYGVDITELSWNYVGLDDANYNTWVLDCDTTSGLTYTSEHDDMASGDYMLYVINGIPDSEYASNRYLFGDGTTDVYVSADLATLYTYDSTNGERSVSTGATADLTKGISFIVKIEHTGGPIQVSVILNGVLSPTIDLVASLSSNYRFLADGTLSVGMKCDSIVSTRFNSSDSPLSTEVFEMDEGEGAFVKTPDSQLIAAIGGTETTDFVWEYVEVS